MAIKKCRECKKEISSKATHCPSCGAPTKKSNGLAIIVLVIMVFWGFRAMTKSSSSDVSSESLATSPQQPNVPLQIVKEKSNPDESSALTYEIVKQDKSDTQIKTQVLIHAVVSGIITHSNLSKLLRELYVDACSMRDFKNHGGVPTNIFIYLYASREHFASGAGQWIAMLSKTPRDVECNTTVKAELIAQFTAEPEVIFGLSEFKRKEIFNAIGTAEDRSYADAERLYPLPDPQKPYAESQARAQFDKQITTRKKLTAQYKTTVATQHGITAEQLNAISLEGLEKNWPMPLREHAK